MTPAAPSDGTGPQLRADAARNRARILAAARAAFRERGTAAPLDEIARRAGVNIATLYRRFPDGEALIRQVVIDGYTVLLHAAQTAVRETPDGALPAIERWLLGLVAEREMLVLPLIGGPVVNDAEALAIQRELGALLDELLATARDQGAIRPDVTAADLTTTVALACRPLPHLDAATGQVLAERHVRVFLDGLRPGPDPSSPLPPGPTLDEVLARVYAAGPTPTPTPTPDSKTQR
ncbi:TetR/AcrR family transcriptional regulator [Catenulispora pinisilvae]|uniref:TetR/AcrR family transcriptional regulator n=1 Tax=Catenulispora pinisilvae TaxID=2705253 RepID=UPI001890F3FE|nr:TetR/AcrR family transcriptional regulator [Catenulispora pinisilvae]